MNTEQSYENVAPGATAPQKTTLFNASRTKVHITAPLRDLLGEPEDVHKFRSVLRSWFLLYITNPDERSNPYSVGQNTVYYELFDDFLSEVIELHFGFYAEPVSPVVKAAEWPESVIARANFIEQAHAILKKQDDLANQIFGPEPMKSPDSGIAKSAMEIQTGLKDCWKMLNEMISSLTATLSK